MTSADNDEHKTAGVTVWIGDRSITREIPLASLVHTQDRLALEFADAYAELRAGRWDSD